MDESKCGSSDADYNVELSTASTSSADLVAQLNDLL